MPTEGMVDALRLAHRTVRPDGFVVDLHPSESRAVVDIAGRRAGDVGDSDGPERHAAAGAALAAVIHDGLFTVDRKSAFDFYTYGDSIDELREYVAENWRDGRIDGNTIERARVLLRSAAPGTRPRIYERIYLMKLLPTSHRATSL